MWWAEMGFMALWVEIDLVFHSEDWHIFTFIYILLPGVAFFFCFFLRKHWEMQNTCTSRLGRHYFSENSDTFIYCFHVIRKVNTKANVFSLTQTCHVILIPWNKWMFSLQLYESGHCAPKCWQALEKSVSSAKSDWVLIHVWFEIWFCCYTAATGDI